MSEHNDFITVTQGMSGYFAVWLQWNPKHDGFWKPWTTGVGRYDKPEDARIEAKAWASDLGINYKKDIL